MDNDYPEQLEQVQIYCQEAERSISWVVRQALKEYLCKVAQKN
ncbi:ribbon-helix-helix protein, CopG family [Anaerostipes caccae]